MKRLLLPILTCFLLQPVSAQFSFSCAKDTSIGCAQTCITLQTKIPDIHAFSDDYGINLISGPGGCFRPPINPAIPGVSTNLDRDDRYTPTILLPFLFSFYGINYLQCVVNTNGIISFDLTNASTGAQWIIQGLDGNLPSTDYDRAIIMGAFHDIDISEDESPTRQIKYDVIGTAPHRKWVLTFYKIPCFQCNELFNNTYQITLYEGVSLVEVHVFARQVCNTWNAGAAMIGMQNYDRNKGIMAPGRSAFTSPRWQGANMNEAWRFTPKQGPSLFKKVELTELNGNVVATGTVAPGGNNDFIASFPNICPTQTTTYLVKSSYYNQEYPFHYPARDSIIEGVDTITVYKNGSIPAANVSTTAAVCGPNPNGTIVVTNPVGPNYEYSIDGGTTYQPGNSFTVLPGTYTVTIHDVTGTCTKDTTVVVGSPATFTAIASSTNTSCITAADGSITVTPAVPGTYTYDIDNAGIFGVSNIFTNQAAGVHQISVKDASGCVYGFSHSIQSDAGFTTTATAINASCRGLLNGTITVDAPVGGQAPYSYSIGTLVQPANPVFNNLLGDSTYTIIVLDNVGCADTITQLVNSNAGVTATHTSSNASCAGVSNGSITITPANGAAPYFYDTTGTGVFVPLTTLNNLAAGTYSITIRDNVGCIYNVPPVSISNNAGVRATVRVTPTACTAASTGSIILSVSSGSSPYRYSLNSGADVAMTTVDTIPNLAAGNYLVRVKDNVGCYTDLPPITVMANDPGIVAAATALPTACDAAITGQVVLSVSSPVGGGVGPYAYNLNNNGFVALNDTIRNLDTGYHQIIVRDALGCTTTVNPLISAGAGVSATDSVIVSACNTASTGKIFIKNITGIAPFRFSRDSGATWQNNIDSFTNLAPGNFNIAVRDAVGCTYHFTSSVGVGAGVTATDSTVVSACVTATTGKIFVKPGLGIAPFDFSIDSGITWQSNIDSFTNLAPGNFNIAVRDAVGCIYHFNSTVGIGAGVNASAVSTNAACLGVSTGTIVITPSSGIAPFTYTLNSGLPTRLDTIRNLSSGSYNIVLSDAVGCSFVLPPVTVNNDIGVTAGFTPVNTACATVATGAIIVQPNTGTAPFMYSIDGGVRFQTDSVFRNLGQNAYTIQVRDNAGCVLNGASVTVNSNPGVVTNASTIQNASCASIPNGSITVNVISGIQPFTYSITSPSTGLPQTGNQFMALFSGSYDILISDSAGCTSSVTSVVGNNPKVNLDSFNITQPTCNGLQNGIVALNVSLGVPPYEYAIDNGPWGNAASFTTVGAGVHRFHIRDANNCAIDSLITIAEPAVLSNTLVSTTKATCSGNPDGKIVVSASGGTTPYEYTLDPNEIVTYQTSPSFDVLQGAYQVAVRDANGCKASINAIVDSVFTMYLDLGADATLCSGSSLMLNPVTNTETSGFSYTPKLFIDNDGIKSPTVSPNDTIVYTLTAQWGICQLTDSITVNVLRKPVANAGSGAVICYDSIAVLQASASNLSGSVNYVWSPANLLETNANSSVVTVRPKEQNTYFAVTVTDNYNCNFSVTDSVLVTMLPRVYAFAGNDTNAVLNSSHQLMATGAGAGGSYIWSAPAGVSISNIYAASPTAIFTPVPAPGTYVPDTNYYVLRVRATDAAGCTATDEIKINVFVGSTIYVPSAFSPNGDGLNDIFKPVPVGVNIEYFRLFNRYGEVVYETSRYMKGWDGMHKGKAQPNGAYVWVFKGKDSLGKEVVSKGTVMLVR